MKTSTYSMNTSLEVLLFESVFYITIQKTIQKIAVFTCHIIQQYKKDVV